MAKRESRKERIQRRREEREKARRRQRYLLIGGVVFLIVAVGALVGAQALRGPEPGQKVAGLGNLHLDSIDQPHADYNSSPPTSGPHVEMHAQSKISSEPVPPEIQVHELEHGGVFLQYNCQVYAGDCEALAKELADIASKYNNQVFVAPYEDMDIPIALTAWERIDRLETVDRDRIIRFIDAYIGKNHGG